jgi:hypothetical protein
MFHDSGVHAGLEEKVATVITVVLRGQQTAHPIAVSEL